MTDDALRTRIYERRARAMMSARYYQSLREKFAGQERKLTTGILACGVLTATCAGLSFQFDWMRWALVAIGLLNAGLSAFHRQRAFNVEAGEAARYSFYFDDRASEWENLWTRLETDPASVTAHEIEKQVAKDDRLSLSRFTQEADLAKKAYDEVYRELGQPLPQPV